MMHPVQSITSCSTFAELAGLRLLRVPTEAILPPAITTSPENGGAPVPSTIVPFFRMVTGIMPSISSLGIVMHPAQALLFFIYRNQKTANKDQNAARHEVRCKLFAQQNR